MVVWEGLKKTHVEIFLLGKITLWNKIDDMSCSPTNVVNAVIMGEHAVYYFKSLWANIVYVLFWNIWVNAVMHNSCFLVADS